MFRQERRIWFPPLGAGTDIPTIQIYSSVPNAKETPKERICVVPTRQKPKPNKSGHSLVPPSAHILSYSFSMPCKRQALLFPTLSPPLSPLLQFGFNFWLFSCIAYCFVPFTAAPLICGLAFRYRVSAACFA